MITYQKPAGLDRIDGQSPLKDQASKLQYLIATFGDDLFDKCVFPLAQRAYYDPLPERREEALVLLRKILPNPVSIYTENEELMINGISAGPQSAGNKSYLFHYSPWNTRKYLETYGFEGLDLILVDKSRD